MSTYHVNANQELFDKWNSLGLRVQLLRHIVQNDMELNDETLNNWIALGSSLCDELEELKHTTVVYIEFGLGDVL
jgi:hypothetical protein